jgi:predicted nucleotidyltransferase component of viral defense system
LRPEKRANLAASVHQRLLNISRKTGVDPNHIWGRFAIERLLYRLACSDHAGEFVLKGAMLFVAWTGKTYRPTYDLDLMGFGEGSAERVSSMFKKLCHLKVEPDGLVFDAESVRLEPIREDQEYHGQRVMLNAFLGKARIPVQVDIGFGDVVTPKPEEIDFPTLLDFPCPRIRACPRETVVAEKLHAMTVLGMTNSRMKDFHDLYVLARDFPFDGATLAKGIKATFKRRKTDVPAGTPLALAEEFERDAAKMVQWSAFVRRGGLGQEMPGLPDVLARLRAFLLPPIKTASGRGSAPGRWNAGGPWTA